MYNTFELNALDFTRISEEEFYRVVDLSDFKDSATDKIYQFLQKKGSYIPFGDYLKRYIYNAAEMSGDYRNVDIKDYQDIIISAFNENNIRQEHLDTSAKISALAKNWLTQLSVSRQSVFLLGFGLGMHIDDISDFLRKALREQDINFKNPDEIIYWYCLKKGYKYPKVLQLKRQYNELPLMPSADEILNEKTSDVYTSLGSVCDDDSLMRFLARFKIESPKSIGSVTAYQNFTRLYKGCQQLVADYLNRFAQDEQDIAIARYQENARHSGRLSSEEIALYINNLKAKTVFIKPEDITEIDIEKILCDGMPRKKDGHLDKISDSKLSKLFSNKRLTRKRLKEIQKQEVSISRFDLITLNFLLYAEDESYKNNRNRYFAFIERTDNILTECAMEKLYVANPYECFLLMCILSDDPLATYTEVWEKSFD